MMMGTDCSGARRCERRGLSRSVLRLGIVRGWARVHASPERPARSPPPPGAARSTPVRPDVMVNRPILIFPASPTPSRGGDRSR